MVLKRGMFQNVRLMVVINEYNAIVPLAIVGVFMRILEKIYPAHRLKMVDQIVQ